MRICEIFRSIQGEGIHTGIPTTFIRTSGCNLRCSWCDTTYALDEGPEMSLEEILERVGSYGTPFVCITGGEPLLQTDIGSLIEELVSKGYIISVETNGSLDISGIPHREKTMISMDVKCPSSKVANPIRIENLSLLGEKDQLKFTIGDRGDYLFARAFLNENSIKCNVVFQPVWGTDGGRLAQWVCEDGLRVRVLTQLHKVFWGTKRRGI